MGVIICLANRSRKQITILRIRTPLLCTTVSSYVQETEEIRVGGASWGLRVYIAADSSIDLVYLN